MTSPVVPPTMTAPPPAPDRADRNTFSQRATDLAAFNKDTGVPEMQLAINSAQTNAISAHESAVAADAANAASYQNFLNSATNASSAAASAGAVQWVSGTTYTIGFRVWSPTNQRIYVRKTAGAGTTDPSADPTNWRFLAGQRPVYRQATGTSATATPGDWIGLANASLSTVTAPLSPSADDEFWVSPENGRSDNKVARNGQLIMGLAEDLDIGSRDETVRLVFVGGSIGWRLLDV